MTRPPIRVDPAPRCPGCRSRRGEALAALRRCGKCGLVYEPTLPIRYPRIPFRKTTIRRIKEE